MNLYLKLFLSACAIAFISCAGNQGSKTNQIIINGSLLDFERGEFVTDKAVLIQNGIIADIKSLDEVEGKFDKNSIIDAKGKFIIPGLIDMHVHIYNINDLISYLKYGVTTVFNLRGAPHYLTWRDSVEAGKWMGPHILTAGPTTDSSPLTTGRNTSIDSPEEAGRLVRLYKERGYHAIKVYNNYKPEVYKALVDSANRADMVVMGHIPRKVGIENTLEYGQQLIAHGEEFFHTYQDEHEAYPDSTNVPELVAKIKKNDTWITPNLSAIAFMIQAAQNMQAHLDNTEQAYLSPNVYHNWLPANNGYANRDDIEYFIKRNKWMYDFVQALTKEMYEEGVPMVTGTDVTVTGYPGLGLQDEINELHKAGLSQLDALKSATVSPGRFIETYIDSTIKRGEIKTGYQADLLLLEENPLDDLKNLENIAGVVVGGNYYSEEKIKEKRAAVRTKNKELHGFVRHYEEALATEDYQEMSKIIGKAYKSSPDNPVLSRSSLLSDAYRIYSNDEKETAYAMLGTSLKWFPEEYSAYYYTGLVYEDDGRMNEARSYYKKCLEIDPFAQMCREKLNSLN